MRQLVSTPAVVHFFPNVIELNWYDHAGNCIFVNEGAPASKSDNNYILMQMLSPKCLKWATYILTLNIMKCKTSENYRSLTSPLYTSRTKLIIQNLPSVQNSE